MLLFAFCRWGNELGFELASSQAKSGALSRHTGNVPALFTWRTWSKRLPWGSWLPWLGGVGVLSLEDHCSSWGAGARLQRARWEPWQLPQRAARPGPGARGAAFSLGAPWVSACSAGAWPLEAGPGLSAGGSLPCPPPSPRLPSHLHGEEWRTGGRECVFQVELPEGPGSEHGERQRPGFRVLVLSIFRDETSQNHNFPLVE